MNIIEHLSELQIYPNSDDAFCECQTVAEAVDLYLYNLKTERTSFKDGDSEYFLDFIVPAECIKILWIASGENMENFKVLIERTEGAVAELGNVLVTEDFCSLAF